MSSTATTAPNLSAPRRVLGLVRLLARPGRQGRAAIALPIVAFCVTTAILLTVVGGTLMFIGDPRAEGEFAETYTYLSLVALLLLAVPTLSLGASAARLSARRRDDRLATLRLLGASSAEVSAITVIEATGIAVAGSLLGVVLYLLLLPIVGLLRFFGEPIGADAVWAGWPAVLVVLGSVAVMSALSAVLGLRRVRLTPLGVRQRAEPTRRPLWLAFAGVAVVVIGAALLTQLSALGNLLGIAAVIGFVLGVFGVGLLVLNLIGPPLVAARGRAMARKAKTPAHLIAGRQLAERPGPSWRPVSGLAMIAFIGVIGGVGLNLATGLQDADNISAEDIALAQDMHTGVLLTLAIAFIMLACSVGVTQAAAVLDDAQLIVGLDRLGVPMPLLERARRITVLTPMRWAAGGGAGAGAILGLPMVGAAAIIAPMSVLVVLATFAAGFALILVAFWSTRPIVGAVRRHPDRAV